MKLTPEQLQNMQESDCYADLLSPHQKEHETPEDNKKFVQSNLGSHTGQS